MLTIRLISKYTIITIHFDILHSISLDIPSDQLFIGHQLNKNQQ